MRLNVLAVGRRMPAWVDSGVAEYAARLPAELGYSLTEVAPGHRSRGTDPARAVAEEGARMAAKIPAGAQVVALDERGESWDTRGLADRLDGWRHDNAEVVFLVGGADGLAQECRRKAAVTWSLSALTLPHGMVRVLLVEQLYRAWSLLNNHPYHRD